MKMVDQTGRELFITETPRRIVSLVPSQTELLCDMRLDDQLVGVTKFCVHPTHVRKLKKVVGGTKQVHLDRIKQLEPDIILCNKEENTAEMVLELEKIAPVHVSDILGFGAALELIKDYGKLFDRNLEAIKLAEKINREKKEFEEELPATKLRVAYFIWREPWMLAGRSTFINTLLEINGLENVLADENSRYPEIDLRELENLRPDIVMLSSEPFPFAEKHKKEILQYIKKAGIEFVDGEYFSWYGSRLLPAFDYFRKFQTKLSRFL